MAAIGGGQQNTASKGTATVAGGRWNTASADDSAIAGGAGNQATARGASVAGGDSNQATGDFSIVAGGVQSVAGFRAFAAGTQAKATHNGAFVWSDSIAALNFPSTAANEFSARATGGVRFVSAINPSTGAPTAGVFLAPGGGAWSNLSDRASKERVQAVDKRQVLENWWLCRLTPGATRRSSPPFATSGPWRRTSLLPSVWAKASGTSTRWTPLVSRSPRSRD
jgi:hypothetical protein